MTKSTTLAALATFAVLSPQAADADHSRNPGLAIHQEHLPSWMRGTNDEAGGPANELIGNGTTRLLQSGYAHSSQAVDPALTGTLEPVAPLMGAVYPTYGNSPHSTIQR
jgi:hypothetical protein